MCCSSYTTHRALLPLQEMPQWCTRTFTGCHCVLELTQQCNAVYMCVVAALTLCLLERVCDSCILDEPLTCSNSSRSTSPSPLRSNILKAISKFLWGAEHNRTHTHTHILKSVRHNMNTPHHTGWTQRTAGEFNTDSIIKHQPCSIIISRSVVQHGPML